MEQLELYPIPSPCVSICTSNSKGYCLGCWRNRDERFHWNSFSDTQKIKVLKLCEQRRRRAAAASQAEPR